MTSFAPLHYLNGKPLEKEAAALLAESSAFLYGLSTFTTSCVSEGVWEFGTKHLQRLSENGEAVFGKRIPGEYLLEAIQKSFQDQPQFMKGKISLRVTLFETKSGQVSFLSSINSFTEIENPWEILVTFSHNNSSLFKEKNIKVGNYSESLLTHKTLAKPFIYIDSNENFSEGPICNFILFNEKDQRWETPDNPMKVLNGIGLVYGLEGLGVKANLISFSEKEKYSAMFGINSLRGPQPVTVWDNQALPKTLEWKNEIEDLYKSNKEKWSVKL